MVQLTGGFIGMNTVDLIEDYLFVRKQKEKMFRTLMSLHLPLYKRTVCRDLVTHQIIVVSTDFN